MPELRGLIGTLAMTTAAIALGIGVTVALAMLL